MCICDCQNARVKSYKIVASKMVEYHTSQSARLLSNPPLHAGAAGGLIDSSCNKTTRTRIELADTPCVLLLVCYIVFLLAGTPVEAPTVRDATGKRRPRPTTSGTTRAGQHAWCEVCVRCHVACEMMQGPAGGALLQRLVKSKHADGKHGHSFWKADACHEATAKLLLANP